MLCIVDITLHHAYPFNVPVWINADSPTSILSMNLVGNWPLLLVAFAQPYDLCFSDSNTIVVMCKNCQNASGDVF